MPLLQIPGTRWRLALVRFDTPKKPLSVSARRCNGASVTSTNIPAGVRLPESSNSAFLSISLLQSILLPRVVFGECDGSDVFCETLIICVDSRRLSRNLSRRTECASPILPTLSRNFLLGQPNRRLQKTTSLIFLTNTITTPTRLSSSWQ